jgi:hypothetical protein
MPRDVAAIAADLDALTAHDFDYANTDARGWEQLNELCNEMLERLPSLSFMLRLIRSLFEAGN